MECEAFNSWPKYSPLPQYNVKATSKGCYLTCNHWLEPSIICSTSRTPKFGVIEKVNLIHKYDKKTITKQSQRSLQNNKYGVKQTYRMSH